MIKMLLRFSALVTLIFAGLHQTQGCMPRSYGESSFVCVCNSTYCDKAPQISSLAVGEARLVSTDKDNSRFAESTLFFNVISGEPFTDVIQVDTSQTFQSVLGFGGAFTDAAGINIAQLSTEAQELLLNSYFAQDGIEYGVGRVPIAGTDFSTRTYSYDDYPGDVELTNFSLTEEDLVYKIPYVLKAAGRSQKAMKLFASPWSAPAWMKSNNEFYGKGYLLPEYYQVWADYFARFFEEYKKFDISFWGLTAQNEPVDGRIPGFPFNCMGWTPENQSYFVGENLGPTLEARGFADLKIMIMDDQRNYLPEWPETVLSHPEANKYTSGFAVHWYQNFASPPSVLSTTHEMFPDRFILATEACEGTTPKRPVVLGAWERLESYAKDIIENMNHWVVGWIDWNLALDEEGGPNWSGNFVDSPIIVNGTADEFYKQPMFYAMGHFSKYVPEGSQRIFTDFVEGSDLIGTGFVTPEGKTTIVMLNRSPDTRVILLQDARKGSLEVTCNPHSMHTLVYE